MRGPQGSRIFTRNKRIFMYETISLKCVNWCGSVESIWTQNGKPIHIMFVYVSSDGSMYVMYWV
jgi:hypothetical protein